MFTIYLLRKLMNNNKIDIPFKRIWNHIYLDRFLNIPFLLIIPAILITKRINIGKLFADILMKVILLMKPDVPYTAESFNMYICTIFAIVIITTLSVILYKAVNSTKLYAYIVPATENKIFRYIMYIVASVKFFMIFYIERSLIIYLGLISDILYIDNLLPADLTLYKIFTICMIIIPIIVLIIQFLFDKRASFDHKEYTEYCEIEDYLNYHQFSKYLSRLSLKEEKFEDFTFEELKKLKEEYLEYAKDMEYIFKNFDDFVEFYRDKDITGFQICFTYWKKEKCQLNSNFLINRVCNNYLSLDIDEIFLFLITRYMYDEIDVNFFMDCVVKLYRNIKSDRNPAQLISDIYLSTIISEGEQREKAKAKMYEVFEPNPGSSSTCYYLYGVIWSVSALRLPKKIDLRLMDLLNKIHMDLFNVSPFENGEVYQSERIRFTEFALDRIWYFWNKEWTLEEAMADFEKKPLIKLED